MKVANEIMRSNAETAGLAAPILPIRAAETLNLRRRLALALVVLAVVALVPAAHGQTYSVFLGYADTLRPNPASFPTPWQGGPNVIYEACTPASSCTFDSGAIRIVNTGASTLTVNSVIANLSTCSFDLWPHTVSLPVGGQIIMAQTTNNATSGCTNNGSFDSSDIGPGGANWAGNCNQSGVIPTIAVTVNGTLTTFTDSGQILNTGGVDKASCPPPGGNESEQWTPVGKAACSGSVLALSPSTQSGAVHSTETVTANLSCGGTPISETNVNFTVLTGPNTNVAGSGVTDNNGNTTFQYTSLVAGADALQATVPNLVGTVYSNQVSVVWTGTPAALNTIGLKVLGQPDFSHDVENGVDASSMYNPQGVAFDLSKAPTTIKAYVVDRNNNRVLGWSSISALTNGAAANIVLGQPDFFSVSANYNGVTPQSLNSPDRVAVDSAGNVYVADFGNNRVLVYKAPAGAGTAAFAVFGQGGDFASNNCNLGNSNAPSPETLCNPAGIAIDKNNNVWIADYNNARVVEYNSPLVANGTQGSGTTVGQMVLGQPNLYTNTCNFNSVSPQSMCHPGDVLADPVSGGIYVADQSQQRALFFPAPQTSTESATKVFGQSGNFTTSSCNFNGLTADSLCTPAGMALDSSSNLYLVDYTNNRILEYLNPLAPPSGGCPSPGVPGCAGDTTADAVFGQAGTFTSNGCNFNNGGGPINATDLCGPSNVAIVPSTGQLWASDASNNRTLIFNSPSSSQAANLVLGQGTLSTKSPNALDANSMGRPQFVAVDQIGGHLYVSDTDNNRVLGYKSITTLTTGQAADIVIGQPDFVSGGCNTNGVTPQGMCSPTGVAVDSSGNLYVADYANNRVLEFNTPFGTGQPTAGEAASNVWGQGGNFYTNGCNLFRNGPNNGLAGAGTLCNPTGIFIDSGQDLWVADQNNSRVLLYYSPLLNSEANIVFGQPSFTANFDNNNGSNVSGSPSATNLLRPNGVAVDPAGNVYIADENNNRVLEYDTPLSPSSTPGSGSCLTAGGAFSGACTATEVFGQNGKFTTNACNGTGNGITNLCVPTEVTLDPIGDLLVTDFNNNRLLLYRNPLSNTVSNQVFGQAGDFQTNGCNFLAGVTGNSASPESLCNPLGLATDSSGNLYVADYNNRRVVFYDPPVLFPHQSNFGTVATGTPVTKTFTFFSHSLAIDVAGVEIAGVNATEFQVTKDACSGKHLGPKSSCSVKVTFTPTKTGVQKAQLSLYDDAYNSPHRSSLVGSGQ